MRFIVGIFASVMRTRRQRRSLRLLGWLGLTFLGLLAAFSVSFHWLMASEGQEHSWVTGVECYVLATDHAEATPPLDADYRAMVGPLDDPSTWRAARVDQAALVATTRSDRTNTNVTFTVRVTGATLLIVATASADVSVDILEPAGVNAVGATLTCPPVRYQFLS
jgi:hypothetical protein